jgi:hypothetical protein
MLGVFMIVRKGFWSYVGPLPRDGEGDEIC